MELNSIWGFFNNSYNELIKFLFSYIIVFVISIILLSFAGRLLVKYYFNEMRRTFDENDKRKKKSK